jgi:hypothetical protein
MGKPPVEGVLIMLSGKQGAVNGIPCVRSWKVVTSADVQAFITSSTSGGTGRKAGNKKWTGEYKGYGSLPAVAPGESFTFGGSIDGVKGCSGSAIVDKVEIVIDIEGGKIIEHTVTFTGNGALTLGAAAYFDYTVADAPTSIGCKVLLGTVAASPEYTELTNVRKVTLSMSADNKTFVNSSTAGETGAVSGNIDAEVSISVHTVDFSALPTLNTVKSVQVFVNATEFWQVDWMIFDEASDLEVNPESGDIVGATLTAKLAGVQTISAVDTIGAITDPEETVIWPNVETS